MSFFNAPAWAQKPTPAAEDLGKDMFSHSGSFLSIAQDRIEREKRRTEKAAVRAAEKERKRAKDKEKDHQGSSKRESNRDEQCNTKKRRISAEDSAELLAQTGLGQNIEVGGSGDEMEASLVTDPPTRRSPRINRTRDMLSPARPQSKLGTSTNVDAEEDDIEVTGIRSRPLAPPPVPEEEDSDPEIAEIQRRARAKAQLKAQQQKALSKADSPDSNFGIGGSGHPVPPAPDPAVPILISSPIPNTNPLIVYRKLSQNLQPVKDMWCKKQEFDQSFSRTVFLVHRGHRLYDSTTVRRLDLEVDASGQVRSKENPTATDADKVHVLAMTQKEFEEMKAIKAQESKVRSGAIQEDVDPEEAEPQPTEQKGIRVTVKAKDKAPFKVKVTPGTKIVKIIKAAKKSFRFSEDQSVYIEFDGERVNPEETVGSTEIEDMDSLDMFLES